MRVALVHNFHTRGIPSGEDVVVLAEAAALQRAGVDVQIVGTSNDEMAKHPAAPLRAAAAVATGIGVSPESDLRSFDPDVVHIHGTFPYLDRRWLRRLDVPLVVTSHNYRPMCANGYLFRDGQVCTRCLDGQPWSGVRYGCYRGSRLASLPLAVGGSGSNARPVWTRRSRVACRNGRGRCCASGVPRIGSCSTTISCPRSDAAQRCALRHLDLVGRLSRRASTTYRAVADDEPLLVVGDGNSVHTRGDAQPTDGPGNLPSHDVIAREGSFGGSFRSVVRTLASSTSMGCLRRRRCVQQVVAAKH